MGTSEVTGTLANARLSGTYSYPLTISNGTFSGDGAGLSSVNATTLDGIDSLAFGRLASAQTWIGANTFNNALGTFTGDLNGDGAGLTNVNAATLDGIDSLAFGRLAATQTFSGANTFTLNSAGTSSTATITRSGYVGEFGPAALQVTTNDAAAEAISATATVAGSVGVSVSSQGTGISVQTLGSIGQAGYFLNGSATNNGAAVQIMSMGAPIGTNAALSATCTNGRAAYFQTADAGTYALRARSTAATSDYAGWFEGRVQITGDCNVSGTLSKTAGSFKIDHPLDPENKFLYHSFVESPDMMNVYNGNIVTDDRGYATVQLPDWFEALNRDFRYQLTVIDEQDSDGFVQAKIVRGVKDNQFTVRTSSPRATVSWQVTGIRQDAYALAHPIPVEADKTPSERGRYQFPELYGMPAESKLDAEEAVSSEDGE
ncbi:MAG: hypothetical protein HZB38_12840 [Planctomycetes bacterium]|nr:hypothetical protein [Planctomycetota bacterium]